MKILQSLMSRYLLLILFALALFPLIPAVYYSYTILFNHKLYATQELETLWQNTAVELDGQGVEAIEHRLQSIKNNYPEAGIFWITVNGETRFIDDRPENIPDKWTFADSLKFMEERKFFVDTYLNNREPQEMYTTTALIGNDSKQGVIVFQLPLLKTDIGSLSKDYIFIALFLCVIGFFIVISWLFFYKIRKRLVQLQMTMSVPGNNGVPDQVEIKRMDEIGRLESAFNDMVNQLNKSRANEQKEENMRKQLIANISHDLRTPLTVIRQHVYSVKNASDTSKEIASLQIVENKLEDMDNMINNLLSYTLLSAGKHPMNIIEIDILDEIRKVIAEWYPILEKYQFEIAIDLPDKSLRWNVDPIWLKSILDNLIQNIVRHARLGRYIGIKTVERYGSTFIVIEDRGKGFEHESENKGVGIGLSIVTLMMKEMCLEWDISTSSTGTCISFGKKI